MGCFCVLNLTSSTSWIGYGRVLLDQSNYRLGLLSDICRGMIMAIIVSEQMDEMSGRYLLCPGSGMKKYDMGRFDIRRLFGGCCFYVLYLEGELKQTTQ